MYRTISLVFTLVLTSIIPIASADTLMVYSARKDSLIKPLFDLYEQQTGATILYKTDKAKRLMRRLRTEGKHSPADILITVDAGHLWFAANQDVFASIDSETLQNNIPDYLRDPDNRWFGLSVRARTLIYNADKVKAAELKSYEDLASPKWQGRLCLRTSKKVYNHSLVAMLINRHGVKKTEEYIKGWVNNLAMAPHKDDSAVMDSVERGECDVGIINSYYFGRYQKKFPATALKLFWPDKKDQGVHVNVSGAGITKHSRNKTAAQRFIEWLSMAEAQHLMAKLNMEYPVNPDIEPSDVVKSWGEFEADTNNLSNAGRLQKYAVRLMERAGYQ